MVTDTSCIILSFVRRHPNHYELEKSLFFFFSFANFYLQQECIPVGCVPSRGGVSTRHPLLLWSSGVVAFWCGGLLVWCLPVWWSSVMAFCPPQTIPEGHLKLCSHVLLISAKVQKSIEHDYIWIIKVTVFQAMGSSTGVRHERQEVSSTDSPKVEGSNLVTGSFFCWIYLL